MSNKKNSCSEVQNDFKMKQRKIRAPWEARLQIEALRKAAGQSVVDLIVPRADEAVVKIVVGWPQCLP